MSTARSSLEREKKWRVRKSFRRKEKAGGRRWRREDLKKGLRGEAGLGYKCKWRKEGRRSRRVKVA